MALIGGQDPGTTGHLGGRRGRRHGHDGDRPARLVDRGGADMLTVEPTVRARPRRHHRRRRDGAASHITTMVGPRGHGHRRHLRAIRGGRTSRRGQRSPTRRSPSRRTSPTGSGSSRGSRPRLDAVMIVTPHALHFAQATACLEAGLDVLLEKPMVMDAAEASRSSRLATGPAGSSWSVSRAASRRRSGRRRAMLRERRARRRSSTSMRSSGRTGAPYRRHMAPGSGDVRRRVPVRHRRPHAQHGRRPRGRGRRRGRGLARGRRQPGRHPRRRSWLGSPRERSSR